MSMASFTPNLPGLPSRLTFGPHNSRFKEEDDSHEAFRWKGGVACAAIAIAFARDFRSGSRPGHVLQGDDDRRAPVRLRVGAGAESLRSVEGARRRHHHAPRLRPHRRDRRVRRPARDRALQQEVQQDRSPAQGSRHRRRQAAVRRQVPHAGPALQLSQVRDELGQPHAAPLHVRRPGRGRRPAKQQGILPNSQVQDEAGRLDLQQGADLRVPGELGRRHAFRHQHGPRRGRQPQVRLHRRQEGVPAEGRPVQGAVRPPGADLLGQPAVRGSLHRVGPLRSGPAARPPGRRAVRHLRRARHADLRRGHLQRQRHPGEPDDQRERQVRVRRSGDVFALRQRRLLRVESRALRLPDVGRRRLQQQQQLRRRRQRRRDRNRQHGGVWRRRRDQGVWRSLPLRRVLLEEPGDLHRRNGLRRAPAPA